MRRRSSRVGAHLGVALIWTLVACVPRLAPAPGTAVRVPLPRSELPSQPELIVLNWELQDPDFIARGDGAARLVPPDTGRLDFFLGGGLGRGAAVLIGDSLRFPSSADDMARRLVPPAPLLWAALGRLAIPALPDTAARVDGDTLRADIGRPVAWRVTFVHDSLRRLERVSRDRVLEWVQRTDAVVRYRNESSRRQLDLTVTRREIVSGFDPFIWDLP
jgi:hypothetical protein